MSEIIERYGLQFAADTDPLVIEFYFIKNRIGDLRLHYKTACQLIWPYLDWHRWTEVCNNEIRRPDAKITVLIGPGSSSKTNISGWQYLLEYYASPDDTLVLISSTDMRGLELRVWGEIKMLHEKALEKYPKLPGYLIDSKHCITTDELEEDDIDERIKTRDLRKGVMCVPTVQGGKNIGLGKWQGIKQKHVRLIADDCTAMSCFPKGTLVETPSGRIPIENIKPGDSVFSAAGIDTVKKTTRGTNSRLIKIKTQDGREIVCTPKHPIFTQDGWKYACHMNQSSYIVSTYEAMQILRGKLPANKQRKMLPKMSVGKNKSSVSPMRDSFSERKNKFASRILQSQLLVEASSFRPGVSKKVLHESAGSKDSKCDCGTLQKQSGGICRNAGKDRSGVQGVSRLLDRGSKSGKKQVNIGTLEKNRAQAEDAGRERNRADSSRENAAGNILSNRSKQFSGKNKNEDRKWIPAALQGGCCVPGNKISGGSGWGVAQQNIETGTGCEKNKFIDGSWVDSVEIYEQAGCSGYSKCEGGIEVYNLEVEKHPSYSVSGFLVHNSTFLSAFANLNNNVDFQAIVVGNPDDILDPLGIAAEPKDGWGSHLEPTKTSVWDTKFYNGRCINLVGLDSPNFDFPQDQPPRYPYLVSQKKINETLSAFDKDSFEYYSQCVGTMKISQLSRRVITRDLCRQFHAQDDLIWDGSDRTKVAALDAAYGGDRCVGGHAEFGRCIDGKIRLKFFPPHTVPVRHNPTVPMAEEDSISEFEKSYCEGNSIPPENFYHDSTGRGSLGTSLARIWSAQCNPVEYGGGATKRPVTMDTYMVDKKTGERRLKRCDEHYSKFVTELWYSLRYAIEADQIRGLPEDVMQELCMREWDRVKDDKIEVESKIEMKIRTRKSPDLGDWAATILEGARRLGFQISKLGNQTESGANFRWLADLAQKRDKWVKSKQLVHH